MLQNSHSMQKIEDQIKLIEEETIKFNKKIDCSELKSILLKIEQLKVLVQNFKK
jgi:hypothetical protein